MEAATTTWAEASAAYPPPDYDDLPPDEDARWDPDFEIEYVRPYLYPKQLEAIFDKRRYSCIEASTKAGKTVGCIAWLVEEAMLGPGDGANYWWVAPVSNQADIAYTRLLRFLPPGTFTSSRQNRWIKLLNGALIWFKSADRPDSLYGDDVYAAVIDEASRMKENAYHAVRSTLTFTRGRCRFIGNVRGRKNWFYRMCRKAEADPTSTRVGFHRIVADDAVAAGVLDAQEIIDAKDELPEAVFDELYMAKASDDGENPFGAAAILARIGPLSPMPPRCWGWDLAKKRDYTVGVALDDHARVCRAVRFRLDWGSTTSRILALTKKCAALVDSTGVGDPIVEGLQRSPGTRFEGYHFTQQSKQKLMEGLATAMQTPDAILFPADLPPGGDSPLNVPFQFELEQFEYSYTKTGVRYSAPEGFNDDVVMALALARECYRTAPAPLRISAGVLAKSAFRH